MIDPPALTAEGEEHWQRLRRHVEWTSGFGLVFVFCSNPALQAAFYQRLADLHRTRVSQVERLMPSSPENYPHEVLGLIRSPSEVLEHARAPLWVDLNQDGDAWRKARDTLVARLNEHRELLRKRFQRVIILVLPHDYRPQLRDLAPDLWSIRNLALDLDSSSVLAAPAQATRDGRGPEPEIAGPRPPSPRAAGTFEQTVIAEWARLAAADPEVMRDLSVSLERVGDVARVLGRIEAAEGYYREALLFARRLKLAFPEDRENEATVLRLETQISGLGTTSG